MPADPFGNDRPTPGTATRHQTDRGGTRIIRRYLEDLALRGPHLARPLARVRAEAIVAFIRAEDPRLAECGLPVDRRAMLLVAATLLRGDVERGDWTRVCSASAHIAEVLASVGIAVASDGDDGHAVTTRDLQLRWLWSARNTDGVTLGDAVAAVRARTLTREGTNAPPR